MDARRRHVLARHEPGAECPAMRCIPPAAAISRTAGHSFATAPLGISTSHAANRPLHGRDARAHNGTQHTTRLHACTRVHRVHTPRNTRNLRVPGLRYCKQLGRLGPSRRQGGIHQFIEGPPGFDVRRRCLPRLAWETALESCSGRPLNYKALASYRLSHREVEPIRQSLNSKPTRCLGWPPQSKGRAPLAAVRP